MTFHLCYFFVVSLNVLISCILVLTLWGCNSTRSRCIPRLSTVLYLPLSTLLLNLLRIFYHVWHSKKLDIEFLRKCTLQLICKTRNLRQVLFYFFTFLFFSQKIYSHDQYCTVFGLHLHDAFRHFQLAFQVTKCIIINI